MTNLTTTANPIEELMTTKPSITTEFPMGSTSGNYNCEGNSLEQKIHLNLDFSSKMIVIYFDYFDEPTDTMIITTEPTISTTTTKSSTRVSLGIFE